MTGLTASCPECATQVALVNGNIYYRNRYYQPKLGLPPACGAATKPRLAYAGKSLLAGALPKSPCLLNMSADPTHYGDGLNMYAYVGNNPVNFTDPTGLMADDDDDELDGCILTLGTPFFPPIDIKLTDFSAGGGNGGVVGNNGFSSDGNDEDDITEIVVIGTRIHKQCGSTGRCNNGTGTLNNRWRHVGSAIFTGGGMEFSGMTW